MKKHTLRIMIFLLITAGLFIGVHYAGMLLIKRQLHPDKFRLPHNIQTLVMGDSHTQTAINPDDFENMLNVSLSAEPLFCTYYKMKFILDKNPQVKTVILGCSYHNLAFTADSALFKAPVIMERYYPLLDRQGRDILMKQSGILDYYFRYWFRLPAKPYAFTSSRGLFRNVPKEDLKFWGFYYASKGSVLDTVAIKNAGHNRYYDNEGNYRGMSETMVNALFEIAEYCKNNGIQLILFNAPVHRLYAERIPEQAYNEYAGLIDSLETYFDAEYLNLFNMELPDSMYGDQDHVNASGSKLISQFIELIVDSL